MSDPNASLPIAGWYPDPESSSNDRWWNGTSWSDHKRPRDAGAAPATFGTAGGAAAAVAATPAIPAADSLGAAAVNGASATYAQQQIGYQAPAYQQPNPYAAATPQYGSYSATPAYPGYQAPGYGQANPYAQPNPYAYGAMRPPSNTIGMVGFILSMVAILFNFATIGFLGVVGGILSAVGIARARSLEASGVVQTNRGLSIAGTIVGFGGALIYWLFMILIVFLPASS